MQKMSMIRMMENMYGTAIEQELCHKYEDLMGEGGRGMSETNKSQALIDHAFPYCRGNADLEWALDAMNNGNGELVYENYCNMGYLPMETVIERVRAALRGMMRQPRV